MSKEINEMVGGMAAMTGQAILMNAYAKESHGSKLLGETIKALGDQITNKNLTLGDVLEYHKKFFAFVQASMAEWERVEP